MSTKMKTRILSTIFMVFLLAACHTNDINDVSMDNSTIENLSGIKISEHTPVVDWIRNGDESIIHYSFVDYPSGNCSNAVYRYNTDMNTYVLNDKIGICMQDSCVIENNHGKNLCKITRRYNIVNLKQEEASANDKKSPNRMQNSNLFSFSFVTSSVDPITIISPYSTNCNPIPMCYYHMMDVQWNADTQNATQMLIVTEWNGLNMDGTSIDTTIIHHMEVPDNGLATLDDHLFDYMPDGALVNIWLVRENIVTVYYDEIPMTWQELIDMTEDDPTEMTNLMHDHPEYTYDFQNTTIVYGAIAHLPIFLIRNTKADIKEHEMQSRISKM